MQLSDLVDVELIKDDLRQEKTIIPTSQKEYMTYLLTALDMNPLEIKAIILPA